MNFLRNEEPYLRITEYLKYKNSMRKANEKWNISAMKPMPSFLYANKKVDVGGWGNAEEAYDILNKCIDRYETSQHKVKGDFTI